jgi:hypothetical protein
VRCFQVSAGDQNKGNHRGDPARDHLHLLSRTFPPSSSGAAPCGDAWLMASCFLLCRRWTI